MNCKEFEQKWQEEEDSSEVSPQVEKHRQECPACAEMVRDLRSIIQQARQMLPLESPPERMWPQIRQQLENERVIQSSPRRSFPAPVPVLGWLQRLPMGLAYAAVFLMAVGVVYLHNLYTNPSMAPSLVSAPQKTAVVLPQAPSAAGDEAFQQLVEKIPPERRAIYATQLDRVNSSIEQLTTFVHEHPEDPFAREQLFNAYGHRERLWETMVKWEEF
ncbi:MAG: anti-sigma factor [Acidobacteria bacterium]|nr:anti-sigma factor [Acidobacteriota bacterium]